MHEVPEILRPDIFFPIDQVGSGGGEEILKKYRSPLIYDHVYFN